VNETSETSDEKQIQKVRLHQEKFNASGQLSNEESQVLWAVPLSIQSSDNQTLVDSLFETRELELNIELALDQWFKLNPSSVGTYRVSYSSELLSKFLPGISNQTIAPLDRLNLLDDIYALVLSGRQSSVDLLKFISAFRNERDFNVWSVLNSILAKFSQLFAGAEILETKFQEFGRNLLLANVFPYIGWSPKHDEPYFDALLRALVIGRLVGFEEPNVLAECRRLFQKQLEEQQPILVDLRASVYRGVALQGNEETYEQLLEVIRLIYILNDVSNEHFL